MQHHNVRDAALIETAQRNHSRHQEIGVVRTRLRRGKARAIALLAEARNDMVDDLENALSDRLERPAPLTPTEHKTRSNSVFLVHGHDEAAKETVRGFLTKLGIETIILHEHANEGRTIIEKFEAKSSMAQFAVVLLTPDDEGRGVGGDLRARARQNAILELGYFAAKFSRKGVCALKKGDIEVPTDYHGVAYVDLDGKGAWKLELAREMKAAGIRVDMNKAF